MSNEIERELREIKERLDELEKDIGENRGLGSLSEQVEDLRQDVEGHGGVNQRLEHIEDSLERILDDFRRA